MLELIEVKRILRSYGMREEYTAGEGGGANILYCGALAFRLISECTYEWWPHYEQSSGTIVVCESVEDMLLCLLSEGLIALNRARFNY